MTAKARKPRPTRKNRKPELTTTVVRTAVEDYIAARDHFADTDYEGANPNCERDHDAWQAARCHAYDAVVAAMGHPDDWPAALDLGDYLVVIDYNPEDEVDPAGSEPDNMCVLCILPKARIVVA